MYVSVCPSGDTDVGRLGQRGEANGLCGAAAVGINLANPGQRSKQDTAGIRCPHGKGVAEGVSQS